MVFTVTTIKLTRHLYWTYSSKITWNTRHCIVFT